MKLMIVFIGLAAFLAVGGAVFVGMQSFDGVVTERPYERGLQWDNERKEKDAAGWRVDIIGETFTAGENIMRISVRDRNGDPLSDAIVSITLSRPSSSEHDRGVATIKTKEGLYQASVDLPLYGYWDISIHVLRDGHENIYGKRIFAEKSG